MTNQEVIKAIQAMGLGRTNFGLEAEHRVVAESLDKQMPKKPKINDEDENYFIYIECPNCEEILGRENDWAEVNYCPNCGQAIDWS